MIYQQFLNFQLNGIGRCLSTFEQKDSDGKADLLDTISFEDMRCSDMRSLRREIIRNINQRFPSVSIKLLSLNSQIAL